jgi:hypothetical protein
MKKIILTIFFAVSILAACNNNKQTSSGAQTAINGAGKSIVKADTVATTKIKFETDVYDFGKVKQGDSVTHEFKFTNVGTKPLIITESSAACGCTVPKWPKFPIKPGDSGIIKVTFNSTGKSGLQKKRIVIISNTVPNNTVVYLVGQVIGETTKK